MRRRRVGALAASALLAGSLTGCAGGPFVTAGTCVDWVAFDTPADALADASSAVVGTVGAQQGTTDLYGYTVSVWTVHVERWVKGTGGADIRVVSAPETCSEGSPYPSGDPLADASGPQLILLHDENGALRTITPWQGIVPADAHGALPNAWPPGTMGSPAPVS